jgi:hypothetical protein
MSKFGWLFVGLVFGCGDKEESSDSGDSVGVDTGAEAADDADADDGGPPVNGDMPENPGPFELILTGGTTLPFDQPTCQHFRGSTNFRAFWRDSARSHNYVLTMQVMQTFEGAGTYESSAHRVDVKLQEEAPMTGAPTYWTNGDAGDTATVTVTYIDEDVAWGEAAISGMHDAASGEAVSVTPSTLPIWCPDVEI